MLVCWLSGSGGFWRRMILYGVSCSLIGMSAWISLVSVRPSLGGLVAGFHED